MKKLVLLLGVVLVVALGSARTASASVTSFTLDNRATLSATQTEVTVTGSIVCTAGDEVNVQVIVLQSSGQVDATAIGQSDLVCTGAVQTWSAVATVLIGTNLKPGPATFLAGAFDTTDSSSSPTINGGLKIQR